jgi:pSer/pThr/pTyr-binding forkhead associated (FHA) protein
MDVKLVVIKGSRHKQIIALRSTETLIGRRRGCDIRIGSSRVSRRHCLLSLHAGSVMVQDLDSVNGTFVNGQRVVGKRLVRPGDRLDVGPVSFAVNYVMSRSAPAQEAPPAPAAELNVLPAVEEGGSPFAFHEEEPLDELELVEEDTEYVPEEPEQRQPAVHQVSDSIEEVLPVEEGEEDDSPLRLDPDAQNAFSDMNRPGPGKSPGGGS